MYNMIPEMKGMRTSTFILPSEAKMLEFNQETKFCVPKFESNRKSNVFENISWGILVVVCYMYLHAGPIQIKMNESGDWKSSPGTNAL